MTYQAKRFSELPDLKARIESLLSETNQEVLQHEELLNCGSRRKLTEKDISVEKTTAGSLDEEFFSSVEGFRDRMQQARTDEVVAPLPPIAGQPENSREQGGSKNESKSSQEPSRAAPMCTILTLECVSAPHGPVILEWGVHSGMVCVF